MPQQKSVVLARGSGASLVAESYKNQAG